MPLHTACEPAHRSPRILLSPHYSVIWFRYMRRVRPHIAHSYLYLAPCVSAGDLMPRHAASASARCSLLTSTFTSLIRWVVATTGGE